MSEFGPIALPETDSVDGNYLGNLINGVLRSGGRVYVFNNGVDYSRWQVAYQMATWWVFRLSGGTGYDPGNSPSAEELLKNTASSDGEVKSALTSYKYTDTETTYTFNVKTRSKDKEASGTTTLVFGGGRAVLTIKPKE